ncbi:MAG TPA: BamA/TamA family outer membrane protein [Planctomycetota bacterium]
MSQQLHAAHGAGLRAVRRTRALIVAFSAVIAAGIAPGAAAAAPGALPCFQEEPAVPQERPEIASIRVVGAGDREPAVLAALSTRVGQRLDGERLQRDQEFLWQRLRVRVDEISAEDLGGNRLALVFRVTPARTVGRVVFQGNDEYDRERLLLEADLVGAQEVALDALPRIVGDIEVFYRREGYYHARATPQVSEAAGQVRLLIEEGPLVRVGDIEFRGNEAFSASTFFGVGNNLNGEIESGDGFLFIPGSRYSEETVKRDLVSLERIYRDYGYLEVEARLVEVSFYRDDSRVQLVFEIHEGPQYTVRTLRIKAEEDGTDLLVPEAELLELTRLEPGRPFERDRLEADRGTLERFYGRRGHPLAARSGGDPGPDFFQFGPPDGEPELTFLPESDQVDVVYRLREGRPMRIRDVVVQGNVHTQDRVIRREIGLEPGDLADTDEAVRSWRRLIGLNYFADPESRQPFVDWRFLPTDRDGSVDLRYAVAEGQTGRLLFGGGVNTNTGPFLSFSIQKDNFDVFDTPSSLGSTVSEILDGRAFTGAGQNLRIFLAPGTDFSTYSIGFSEPDLFGDHIDRTSFSVNLFKTFFFLDTHEETRTGASLRFGRNFGRNFVLYASPETQRVEIGDFAPGAPPIVREIRGANRLNAVTVGARYSTVEDPFSPVDGGSVGLSFRQAGEYLGGDWDFQQTEVEAAKYFPLWTDGFGRSWVLSQEIAAQVGHETGGLSGTPYTERYFLGGQNSLRGFDFRGVGPRLRSFPLGGDAAWYGATELRFPLVSTRTRGSIDEVEYIRGVVFLDYGSVGDKITSPGPTRSAAGIGARLRVPFLPQLVIALDFGWPVKNEPKDDARVFAFNIGGFF